MMAKNSRNSNLNNDTVINSTEWWEGYPQEEKKTITYNTLSEVRKAVESGTTIYWSSLLYTIKIDFDGDLVIRYNNSGELLTKKHLNELFTPNN